MWLEAERLLQQLRTPRRCVSEVHAHTAEALQRRASSWGMSGCSAASGASAPVNSAARGPAPQGRGSGRLAARDSSALVTEPLLPKSRRACCDPTRHTIELTIPRPAHPARAPRYRKRDVGAGAAALVRIEEVVDGRVVLVDRLLDHPPAQRACQNRRCVVRIRR